MILNISIIAAFILFLLNIFNVINVGFIIVISPIIISVCIDIIAEIIEQIGWRL